MNPVPAALAQARTEFLEMVKGIRPELHRYCARLTGSVVEGEDLVQETLARAFYTMGLNLEVPPLRRWLFRIAHNAGVDLLKSHGRNLTEVRADLDDVAGFDDRADPGVVRAALAHFLTLPSTQRNATILKDVLGHSLEETAETMGTTVMAVKAALVRGRAKLREQEANEQSIDASVRAELDRYATLFNARDWEGVRALIGTDCRLDLVSKAHRRGQEVVAYFGNYAKEDVSLRVVRFEGRLALAAREAGAPPSYFILLEWSEGLVTAIRDFRYVPYIAAEAEFEPA